MGFSNPSRPKLAICRDLGRSSAAVNVYSRGALSSRAVPRSLLLPSWPSRSNSLAQAANAPVSRFYRPEIDLLRLIAFAMVFAHHVLPRSASLYPSFPPAVAVACAALANAAGFGLSLFFVLSGYLISELLLREHTHTGSVRLGAFYVRRALRIWPLYFLGVAIGVIWALELARSGATMFLHYLTFTGNWWFQTHSWSANPMTPLWSISIEEQFYFLFPPLLLLCGVRRLPLVGAALVSTSLVGLFAAGAAGEEVDTVIWTSTISQSIFLGTGVLLAWAGHERAVRLSIPSRALTCAGAVSLLIAAAAGTQAKYLGNATSGCSVAGGYLLVALASAMIMVAAANLPWSIPEPLLRAGQLTFGLYIFHELALTIAKLIIGRVPLLVPVVALMVAVLLAQVSRAVIERPAARWRRRFQVVPSGATDEQPPHSARAVAVMTPLVRRWRSTRVDRELKLTSFAGSEP